MTRESSEAQKGHLIDLVHMPAGILIPGLEEEAEAILLSEDGFPRRTHPTDTTSGIMVVHIPQYVVGARYYTTKRVILQDSGSRSGGSGRKFNLRLQIGVAPFREERGRLGMR